MPSSTYNNILIVRTDRIGDVVLTTPAIKAIRKAYPSARISILISPAMLALVKGNPYIDDIIFDDRKKTNKGFIGFLELARNIRKQNYDSVFVFHTKRRYNLACFLAGVPVRIGYKNDKYGFLLTHPVKDTRHLGEKHEAQYCMDLLDKAGIPKESLDCLIPVDREAEQWANEWVLEQGLKSGQFITLHAGALELVRSWPAAKFAKLVDGLQERYQIKPVLIGSPATAAICGEIMKLSRQKPIDLSGKTSLAQTVSILRRSRLLISTDSGPAHVGAALGIHVITIFLRNQPGVNPERWRPLSDKGVYLFSPQGVEPEQVLAKVEEIFQKNHQESFHW